MDAQEFEQFYDALIHAQCAHLHDFEDEKYFEGCMPIEEMAKRGKKTLLFGPLKPVGLQKMKIIILLRSYSYVRIMLQLLCTILLVFKLI